MQTKKSTLYQLFSIQTLLYIALVLALIASLGHVAFAFSTTNGNNWAEAYISAIAIDLGLLALAVGIHKRVKAKRSTWPLWFGVALFSVISTYANWLAGIVHVEPIQTEVGQWGQWLVSLRPILLSSVLPVLVIYLSEIVSSDYQVSLTEAEKEAKKIAKAQNIHSINPNDTDFDTDTGNIELLDVANQERQLIVELRREKVHDLSNQGNSQAQIADQLGVSLSTVKRDTKALNGQVSEVWRQ